VEAFIGMAEKVHASMEDLHLLFIYLEVSSMVVIHLKTIHWPVRFLLYVGKRYGL
jgi:phosphate starvation-inducible membrane PsiE